MVSPSRGASCSARWKLCSASGLVTQAGVDQAAQVEGLGQVGLGGQRQLDSSSAVFAWPREK
jgi:hypothetical protein